MTNLEEDQQDQQYNAQHAKIDLWVGELMARLDLDRQATTLALLDWVYINAEDEEWTKAWSITHKKLHKLLDQIEDLVTACRDETS